MFSLKVFVIAFLLLPAFGYPQTCVIAKKTKRAIYVGADSRAGRYSQNEITKELYFDTFSVCKIYHAGNANFALIGAYLQEAKTLALQTCENTSSFDILLKEYARSFDHILSERLSALKQQNTTAYNNILRDNNPFVSQIIFFGVDYDTLVLKHIGFKVMTGTSLATNSMVIVHPFFGSFNPDAAGHTEEIKDTLTTQHVFKKGIRKTINRLIQIEANAHPLEVGGDTDIIKVKRRKTKWLQRKQCY